MHVDQMTSYLSVQLFIYSYSLKIYVWNVAPTGEATTIALVIRVPADRIRIDRSQLKDSALSQESAHGTSKSPNS